ncbi:MAG: hypothetical protein IPL26_10710 [Leptospiraceae bacterium]|nr:hypothetical protein [Leptospiraceae bacterium]
MPEELEEKIIDSEEIEEFPSENSEEEEYATTELNWKQKLILINSGIFAFLLISYFFISL